jgi:hypothetical protein
MTAISWWIKLHNMLFAEPSLAMQYRWVMLCATRTTTFAG